MNVFRLALLALAAPVAWSQTTDIPPSPDPTGPTILSRGDMQLPPDTSEHRIVNYANFFAFATGSYNFDLGSPNPSGSSGSSYGWQAGGGVSLAHTFEHGLVAFDYTGGYRDYANIGAGSKVFQAAGFRMNYKLSKRWLLALRESIQIIPQGQAVNTNVGDLGNVGFNFVAERQQFYVTSASLVYQKSLRWSYEFAGDFIYNNFQPSAYFNSKGFGGSASADYRLTGRTTVGLGYTYSYFGFSSDIGHSDTNSLYGSLSHVFSHSVQFGLSVGASRTDFTQQVLVSGVPYTFSRISASPYIDARLSKQTRHTVLTVRFTDGVNAGNGIFATSKILNTGIGLGYVANKRLGLSTSGGYAYLTSIGGALVNDTTSSLYVSGSASYKLTSHLGASLSASYVSSGNAGSVASFKYSYVSAGLYFSSQDRPVFTF